jgi:hypothetical protein
MFFVKRTLSSQIPFNSGNYIGENIPPSQTKVFELIPVILDQVLLSKSSWVQHYMSWEYHMASCIIGSRLPACIIGVVLCFYMGVYISRHYIRLVPYKLLDI